MADLNIKGLTALQAVLDTLPGKMQKNVMRGGLRAGMKVIQAAARQNAAKDSGLMAKGLKISTDSKGGAVIAKLKATGKHAHLAPWMEYGTQPHSIRKGARVKSGKNQAGKPNPGLRSRPFMRPALDSHQSAAVVAVGNYIKDRLATKNGIDTAHIEIEGGE